MHCHLLVRACYTALSANVVTMRRYISTCLRRDPSRPGQHPHVVGHSPGQHAQQGVQPGFIKDKQQTLQAVTARADEATSRVTF